MYEDYLFKCDILKNINAINKRYFIFYRMTKKDHQINSIIYLTYGGSTKNLINLVFLKI